MTMFTRSEKVSEVDSTRKAIAPGGSSVSESGSGGVPNRVHPSEPQRSSQAQQHDATPSVISKALKITGQLESSEDIQIDGNVEGDIRGLSVTVGSGANIKGTVYGDSVELAGSVTGKIEAKSVVLTKTARMTGDVIHQEIRIDAGAFIDGHCRPEFGKSDAKGLSSAGTLDKEKTK